MTSSNGNSNSNSNRNSSSNSSNSDSCNSSNHSNTSNDSNNVASRVPTITCLLFQQPYSIDHMRVMAAIDIHLYKAWEEAAQDLLAWLGMR